jgi:hypothetical protein
MATQAYLTGRRRYQRPQAILWSENAGTLIDGFYVPTGYEIGADTPAEAPAALLDQFLILSDHNRGEIGFKQVVLCQVSRQERSRHLKDI